MTPTQRFNSEATSRAPGSGGERTLRRLGRLQLFGVLVLYPGFFFYHTAVSFGAMPPILGGFYGISAVLLTIPALFFYWKVLSKKMSVLTDLDIAFLGLCLYMALWSLIHSLWGQDYQRDPVLLSQSFSIVMLWIPNYLLFRGFTLGSFKSMQLAVFSALGMFALAVAFSQQGYFNPRMSAEELGVDAFTSTYQGFARSAVLSMFILVAYAKGLWAVGAYLVGIVFLFLLGARSEFVGFLIVGFCGLSIALGWKRFLLVAGPLVLLTVVVLSDLRAEYFDGSRIARSMQFVEDTSWASRTVLTEIAWNEIIESPLLGNYGGYSVYGGAGMYAHNILSVWHGFGLVGFVGFAYLIVRSLTLSMRHVIGICRRGHLEGQSLLAFLLVVFVTVLVVFAKDLSYPLVAAAWGMAAGLPKSQVAR